MKDTFIIRTEWFESISELDDTEQAMVFRNLFYFHNGEENLINLNNRAVKLVWKLLEPNLKRNIDNYDKRCETSASNGKLGGRPKKGTEQNLNNLKKPNEKPNENEEPNETLNDSDSDSVLDSEPVIVIDTEEEKEKPTAAADNDDVPFFVKEQREKITPPKGAGEISRESLKADFSENDYCRMQAGREGIQSNDYENLVNEFILEKFGLEENTKWKDIKDARSHFVRWIPYFKSKTQKQNEGSTKNTGYSNSLRNIDNKNPRAAF